LRGIAGYEFDLYVSRDQKLCEEFTQADFLPYLAAVGANAIGGAARLSALWALPQCEFEIPRDKNGVNSAVLKLCDHLVWICDRRVTGRLQQPYAG